MFLSMSDAGGSSKEGNLLIASPEEDPWTAVLPFPYPAPLCTTPEGTRSFIHPCLHSPLGPHTVHRFPVGTYAPQGTPSAHCTPPEVTRSTLHTHMHMFLRARTEHIVLLCAHPLRAHTEHTGPLCAHIPESIHSWGHSLFLAFFSILRYFPTHETEIALEISVGNLRVTHFTQKWGQNVSQALSCGTLIP